ncbi:MAG: hypothetical protein R3B59_10225 [Dehalococcoidia bacterium]
MGFGKHLLVLTALVVNLWLGGNLIEQWAGHAVRSGFEGALILGYLAWVLRFGGFRGRGSGAGSDGGEARDGRR